MVSRRQLDAIRSNAKRSTGPKTGLGKARAARNSLRHGLTSRQIVIGDEDPRQFEELRRGLEGDFKLGTTIETELVELLPGQLWRLRRVPVLQAALMQARREEVGQHDLMSLFSPDDRKQLDEIKDWLWQDRETHSRLNKVLLAETGDPGAVYAASLEPAYNERLAKFREEVAKEARPAEQVPENPNQATINLGLSLIKDSENHDTLGKLSRYEAGLLNAITRTLSLLHSLQKSEVLSR